MKKLVYTISILLLCFFAISCKKEKEEQVNQTPVVSPAPVKETKKPEPVKPATPKKVTFDSIYDFKGQELSTSAFHTDAHKEFLDDPMEFIEVPTQNITEGQTAVVASKVCQFYPEEAFSFDGNTATVNDNIESLGEEVPFGTIVKIGEKLLNKNPVNDYSQQMFNFQDNWNWFYPAEWEGKKGYVFGADLYGLKDTIENNRVSAMLYQTGGVFDSFYPITGYTQLEKTVLESLENNRLAMQKVAPVKWVGCDDMIDCYSNLRRNKAIPIFITTDLAAHSQHLIFDRMLQYTEENYFLPQMLELTNDFIKALSARTDAPEQIREQAIQYFQVPQAIMETAPLKFETGNYYEPIQYQDRSEEDILNTLSNYPDAVKNDYELVMNAMPGKEAIFGEDEDFTQYKPRGHYTKNKLLETYFRATMWYGHLHFTITKPRENQPTPEEILQKEAVITLVVDTIQKDGDLYIKWANLFNPITTLIGMSDDLSFDDICPLWKDQNVTDYSEWASNRDNIVEFMSLCTERLRPPAISGQSVFEQYFEIDEETGLPTVPMGWRMFGQRFTYDSLVHEKVSPPRLLPRDIVRGLDIMKAFGSKTADALLQKSDYPEMPGLKEILDSLETSFAEYDSDFWNKTYYNQVLYQVKTQATFEQGAGFYFTESPAWNIKSQIAAHGTWAELRHDTILYVKQVVAERAGDGDFEPTFRTEPLPKPVHYIEPNVPFWEGSLASVANLMSIYEYYDLLDDESKTVLENLSALYKRILMIVRLEAENQPVSENDLEWIPTIAYSLNRLVMVHTNGGYSPDNDQLKMACIADVYTNNQLGVCLEVGVANPVRLYVPLNDSQGGKRIAVGYGFSYAEFTHPMTDRLTDEKWKNIVYKQKKDLTDYMPFWEKECFVNESQLPIFR